MTNKHSLPEPLVEAVLRRPYDSQGSYITATGLLNPPLIRKLRELHDDEIEEDAIDSIWSLLGTIGHNILEHATKTGLSEKRLFTNIAGKKFSGQFDHLSMTDGKLCDYKFTSAWSVVFGKPEWGDQLNILHWLLYINGFWAESLWICAVLRDWDKNKARADHRYPQQHVAMVEFPLWSLRKQEEFIARRLAMHIVSDENIVAVCSDEDRWKKNDTWAVKKKGAKRAVRVLDNQKEADDRVEKEGKGYSVEHRPGTYNRCEGYCPVKPFCPEYANGN